MLHEDPLQKIFSLLTILSAQVGALQTKIDAGFERVEERLDRLERRLGNLETRNVLDETSQMWFSSSQWQVGEREAQEDISAGRGDFYENSDVFLKSLWDNR